MIAVRVMMRVAGERRHSVDVTVVVTIVVRMKGHLVSEDSIKLLAHLGIHFIMVALHCKVISRLCMEIAGKR